MEILDANYILRYLLKDIEDQYLEASSVIENKVLFVPGEIVAEVVYVLQKIYSIPNNNIASALTTLFNYPNINIPEQEIITTAISLLTKNKLDYADNLLVAYNIKQQAAIYTFDKKLNKAIQQS